MWGKDVVAIHDDCVGYACTPTFIGKPLQSELVLGLQACFRPGIIAASVAFNELGCLVQAVKKCVCVRMARLGGELSDGHLEVVSYDRVNEEMCVTAVICSFGSVGFRLFGDAA